MATLEKRITDLESKTINTEHRVRIYLCDEGEDQAQARLKLALHRIATAKRFAFSSCHHQTH
jgi:hypothetical protein